MAEVTIRYAPTGETRQIDENAVRFFPGWDVVRDKPNTAKPTTTTASKES